MTGATTTTVDKGRALSQLPLTFVVPRPKKKLGFFQPYQGGAFWGWGREERLRDTKVGGRGEMRRQKEEGDGTRYKGVGVGKKDRKEIIAK